MSAKLLVEMNKRRSGVRWTCGNLDTLREILGSLSNLILTVIWIAEILIIRFF
jgi:hypothetical protein